MTAGGGTAGSKLGGGFVKSIVSGAIGGAVPDIPMMPIPWVGATLVPGGGVSDGGGC